MTSENYTKETSFCEALSTTNPTLKAFRLNPGLLGGRLTADRMRYGKTSPTPFTLISRIILG